MEKYLIEHCSPTLASIKTASLFSCRVSSFDELESSLRAWNEYLSEKGITIITLKKSDTHALIYVCRKKRLCADLQKPGVSEFLKSRGYNSIDPDSALDILCRRLSETKVFAHEIGIFLGYPLGDVIGFIENEGKNCKCRGCWKVYCDEREAIKTFAQYRKCREIYRRLWMQGRSVWKLTVK